MRYAFGEYTLDTTTLELSARDREITLEPQVFSVLAYLIEHRERVVSKEELLDGVWGDRFVSESALTTRIKQARQAVGDTGRSQRTIRTLHGRGYRFVADVREPSPAAAGIDARPFHESVARVPTTHYAKSDGGAIAYQTFGQGPDLVFIAGFMTNVEVQWEHPVISSFLRRLASFTRVTILDKRGVGLSERIHDCCPPSLETRADDLCAVMDSAGVERATLLGSSEGGSLCVTFAATHPERVDRLVLHATWPRHPWSAEREERDRATIEAAWGTGACYAVLGPGLDATPPGRDFLARYERQSGTPAVAEALRQFIAQTDVTDVLPAVSATTLVLHRRDDTVIPFELSEELAARLPRARLVALDGIDHYVFSGDVDRLLHEIETFVTGSPPAPVMDESVLATVLFVDIVDSTRTVRAVGDDRWSGVLDEFQMHADETVRRFRGVLVNTTGDGLLATFDGPARAVRAAGALRDAVFPMGIRVRAGLHTAEIRRRGDDVAGIGVHIASRVAGVAGPGEVVVSRTVTDLVAGSGLAFTDRGAHELAGLDRAWQLFSALV